MPRARESPIPNVEVRGKQRDNAETRAQWGGQVIYCGFSCAVITPILMKDHLICAKTAMRYFSKALVYNYGNRQRFPRARARYMHALDRARQKQTLKVYMGGRQVQIYCPSTWRESLYY
jgi:hypothetical protein